MRIVLMLSCAVLSGWLLALAFPLSLKPLPLPFGLGAVDLILPGDVPGEGYAQLAWVAFIALIPLFEIARQSRRPAAAFLWGYVAGFIWLFLHWLWMESFGWLPVFLLAVYFALPTGLFTYLVHLILKRSSPALFFWGVPVLWTGIEYLRSFGAWAYPWNFLGYSQSGNLALIQVADITGVYAVSFLVAAVNAVAFMLLGGIGRPVQRLGYSFITAGLLLAVLAYGEARLGPLPVARHGLGYQVALVQGDLPGLRDWDMDYLRDVLEQYIYYSEQTLELWDDDAPISVPGAYTPSGPSPPRNLLIVWPESVLPKKVDQRHPERLPYELRNLLANHPDADLLLGVIGRPRDDALHENGSMLVDSQGEIDWVYSKTRPVPFGEALPFRRVVSFLRYPWGPYDITAGRNLEPLAWRGRQIAALVCYDNIFPFITRSQVARGAGSIILMTNNSWYKLRSGIHQHCQADIFRAIETHRPLARVSTTGTSHLVDPQGRVSHSTKIDTTGYIFERIQPCSEISVYLVIGDLFAQLVLVGALVIAVNLIWIGRSEGFL